MRHNLVRFVVNKAYLEGFGMVSVVFKDDRSCYMDNRLYDLILESKREILKDDDRVFLVDGLERSGKSVLTQQVARVYDHTFTYIKMCFTEEEFLTAIDTSEPVTCVVYDEAYRGLGSDKWAGAINKVLKAKMMEMGQKNLIVFIVCPSFFMLSSYVAVHRSWGLFHVYRKNGERGYWCYFNKTDKQILYFKGKKTFSYTGKGYPDASLLGRFYDQYVIDEVEYRKRKAESYKDFGAEEKKKPGRLIRDDRNKLLYLMYKEHNCNAELLSRDLARHGIKYSAEVILDAARKEGPLE